MSLFDQNRKQAHKTITGILGEDASWVPTEDADPITGKVLLRRPTEKDTENGIEFIPFSYIIRWQEPFFPGLFEAVRSGSAPQLVITTGTDPGTYSLQSAPVVLGKAYEVIAQKL